MRKTLNFLLVLAITVLISGVLASEAPTEANSQFIQRPMDLSGMWRFMLDRTDAGVNQQWFKIPLPERIRLPGILQSQHQGDLITTSTPWVLSLYDRNWNLREEYKDYIEKNVRVPFLSQPPRHYMGVAWYQRDFYVQPNWVNRRIVLTLERPHWETTVWLDGKKIGSDRSLVAPHVYDFGTLTAGSHTLTIRVDNRMLLPYRPDAHSVSDSVGASWNGIVGKIELTTTNRIWIEDAQVTPDLAKKTLRIFARIGNRTGLSGSGTLTAVWPDVAIVPVTWDDKGGVAELEVPIRDEMVTWDEFQPKLHTLRLWLKGETGIDEHLELKVGLRDFKAEGNEFHLNGRPVYFRGTVNNGDFPLTGHPATDFDYWKKLFEKIRSWGLNHMRFHSWCPPKAAFEAADTVGVYLQVEPGMWNEFNPDTPMEKMLFEETDRMIKAYGNHPSFMLLSASNEPKGKWKEVLTKWVERYRKADARRLYTAGTGPTERDIPDLTEGTDYLAVHRIGPKMLRRESGWFGQDYRDALIDVKIPVIAHEVGQWAAYPHFDLIKKFSGYLRPGNLEIFRESLKAHGLLEKNKEFASNSGRFQFAAYKEEIEANLRTPGLSGFQLMGLNDYLGQGTAFVGLLDAFGDPKSYADVEQFKQFCNTTVPLARLRGRVFTTAQQLDADVEVAHYGAKPIEDAKGVWRIGEIHGEWDKLTIPVGKNTSLGNILFPISKLPMGELKLTVTVAPESFFSPVTRKITPRPDAVRGVTYFENEWSFWVYPADIVASSESLVEDPRCPNSRNRDILVTNSWEEAQTKLAAGGKVLLAPRSTDLSWFSPPLDSVPIFWNRLMSPNWSRMLGFWVDLDIGKTKSFMLKRFSTSSHFDWQWAQIVRGARAINLESLPEDLEPVVWAIDDWNRNYKLGVLFELGVGHGRLLVSAIDVTRPSDINPPLAQLRNSLLWYMNTDCFQPTVGVLPEQLATLFFDTKVMSKLGAKAHVNGAPANVAIDGDPNTFLLVGDESDVARDQVELVIDFPAPVAISGFVIMPRQNNREHEGDIREYSIQISDDGNVWSDIARGELPSTFNPHHIYLSRTMTAKHVKLVSLSGFGTDKATSLSEFAIMYAGPKLKNANEKQPTQPPKLH